MAVTMKAIGQRFTKCAATKRCRFWKRVAAREIMIDMTARRQYGELLRHFFAARCTNDEYEERADLLVETDCDCALYMIYAATWTTYDDFKEHRMTGKWQLNKTDRRTIARWILFLQNDLEYEWPYPTIKHKLRRLVTILTFGRFPRFREPAYNELGDYEVWPFFRVEDYERARHSPKLLCGK